MIRLVTLKGFKRFGEVSFPIPGHIVMAGPNNTGKTTLLQAVAAWELGFRRWREMNDLNPRKNGYRWQELERLAFSAVAVRSPAADRSASTTTWATAGASSSMASTWDATCS